MDTMKTCCQCQRDLCPTEFHKDKYKSPGTKSACKNCVQARYRISYRRRMSDPAARKAYNLRQVAWRAANIDRSRQHSRRNRRNNPRPFDKSYERAYRAKHPIAYRQRAGKSRAKQKGCYVESVDVQRMFELFGTNCYICDRFILPEEFELDHVIPISKNGPHILENLRPCHYLCNMAKFNHVVSFFEKLLATNVPREAA